MTAPRDPFFPAERSIRASDNPLEIRHLGRMDYQEAWDYQAEVAAARPEKTYNPMAGEKTTAREPRQQEPRPVAEMKRRPRRRPSNGGKGYGGAAKG